ncbi:MAG: PEGA domain-containing protein [Archangium sp.]|nr:PEGA domain-containing protein [Archangium sp.]
MLSAAVPLIALLLTGPVTKAARADAPKLEQGQKLFNQGDFDGALKMLDAAAIDGGEPTTMEKVQLLRAQCLAARQDFARAEEAFALALDANPDTTLDPARVDPTVVRLLESVRARLTGSLVIGSTPPGATLVLDGKAAGVAPQTIAAPAGKHKLEARWGEGPSQSVELQVRPRRETRVEWVQGAAAPAAGGGLLEPRPLRPFGDLRGMVEPAPTGFVTGGLELGGGIELSWFRIGLFVRLFPNFGVTPRFQFALPLLDSLNAILEVGLPLNFLPTGFGLGLGGGGGVEYYPFKWIGGYAIIGGRHHFIWPVNSPTAFTATVGVRLRVP